MNHKKTLALIIPVMLVLAMSVFVLAKPDFANGTNPSGRIVSIPTHAVEVAPGVFYLGTAIDNGRLVEGYAMFVKPVTECGNRICEPGENARKCPEDCEGNGNGGTDTSSCYGFLAREAKWKTVEDWVVNPTNTRELDGTFVFDNLILDIEKWETAAGVNILGIGLSTNEVLEADLITTDGQNEVYFADIDYDGVIAMAIIWGYFSGPPFARELVEWDMVFDDVNFDWGECEPDGETCKINEQMDFENIATHELGHAVGLGDLYNTECSEVTMYGYSNNGETKKRDLEPADITGIQELYGE